MILSGLVILTGASTACAQSGGDVRANPAAGVVAGLDPTVLYPRIPGTSLAARADSLVRVGRPWRATALLATSLATPASASPELRLAAARAAAAWEGWSEVARVLRDAPWLEQFGGEGRELLARGALEREEDAQPDARAALAAARTDASRALRGVLLARALDRANLREPAAQEYLAAATRFPRVADWLRLRAAGVTSDSTARWALLARVANAPARARVALTDAQARERAGDFVGAARVYRQSRAFGSSFRADALGARTEPAKADLSKRIIAFLSASPVAAEAKQAIETLDRIDVTLARSDELTVARAAAAIGLNARSVTGFVRAAAAAPLTARERFTYAGALSRSGRNPEAARVYASISDSALAPLAAYQGARAMLQSGGAGARDALRRVANAFATTHAAAAPALLLLADLQVDDGDLAGAGASLARIAREHPDAPQAPLARFREALLRWHEGSPRESAALFDSLVVRYPNDDEATAARYWAARALEHAGKTSIAVERWKAIIATAPTSYYAVLSGRRLHLPGWTAPAGADTVPHIAAVDSAASRVKLLQQLGMDVEARIEIDAMVERAERALPDAAAIAQALRTLDESARALRVAIHALDRGAAPSRALYLAAFPVVHADALVAESQRNSLDPALVAGLVRQESSWNPRALSPVGARGLMQLMPSVGASIASSRHFPLWNQALLFEPDVSLELGTAHLASGLRRGDVTAHALAAYNAGASRVTRWARRPDAADSELFTEWIPFVETRDYVRIVQRNAEIYRSLHGLR